MSDDKQIPNPLLVKKKDAKQGDLWHTFANQRIHKQHHGGEIPEGDRHFIPKFPSPVTGPTTSPEDTQAALTALEKQVKELQEKNKQLPQPPPPPPIANPAQSTPDDDWYD